MPKGAEIEIAADDIELLQLEIESTAKGISIEELATRKVVAGMDIQRNRGLKLPIRQEHDYGA